MSRKRKAVIGASVTAAILAWVLGVALTVSFWGLVFYLLLKLTGIVG